MLAWTQTRWRRQFFCSSACAAAVRLNSFLFYYIYTQFEIKHVVNFESLRVQNMLLFSLLVCWECSGPEPQSVCGSKGEPWTRLGSISVKKAMNRFINKRCDVKIRPEKLTGSRCSSEISPLCSCSARFCSGSVVLLRARIDLLTFSGETWERFHCSNCLK